MSAIDNKSLNKWLKIYNADRANAVLRHALSTTPLPNVINDSVGQYSGTDHTFSIEVKTMHATNQKESGRCWIFSALNVLREIIAKKCKISEFELSQSYIAFYDKLEKFNFLLHELDENINNDHNERLNYDLLTKGIADGGQWTMLVNLVKKYGLCPKSCFNETYQTSYTKYSNEVLNSLSRQYACEIHSLHKEGKDDKISAVHESYVQKVYQVLLSCYGIPPQSFNFEYVDSEGHYCIDKDLTPLSFYQKYIGDEYIDQYISVIHAPTDDKKYYKTYCIDHLGNVVEGKKIIHLNLPMERIKELIVATLKDDEVVWFGSDVRTYRDRVNGIWDDKSFDYLSAFGTNLYFDKKDMLDYHESAMGHAMVLTGVNIVDGKINKWKIENSWGDTVGNKGYFIMSDSFFDKYVYQVVINKNRLNEKELNALKESPKHLPLWDPFGTLAD